jgi:hypothetical protein
MKKTLSLALVAAMTCLAAVISTAPAADAAVLTYTGCLDSRFNVVVQVAPGDSPSSPCRGGPSEIIRFSSGDLTSLSAGTGLNGGGANGDISVALAPSFRLPQTCAADQGAAWNGSSWACASFTSQAAFNSLISLLGTAGTINQGSNPVQWTKLKGVPAGLADGVDDAGPAYSAGFGLVLNGTQFNVEPGQVQRRVVDGCAEGSSIRTIAQDGSVTCQGNSAYTAGEGLALSGSEFSVIDGGVTQAKLSFDPTTQVEFDSLTQLLSDVGTINDSDNPVDWTKLKNVPTGFADGQDDAGLTSVSAGTGLSGSGTGGDPLQIASSYRSPQSCTSGQVPKWNGTLWACGNDNEGSGGGLASHTPAANDLSTLDSAGFVGEFSAITVGADGLGLVSYYAATNQDLKIAHCQNVPCTSATNSTLDDQVFGYTSLAIGADGLGLISYRSGGLKVAHCDNVACTSASTSTLDNPGFVGEYTSLAIGVDGLGLVAYNDEFNGDLKVAHCQDVACTSASTSTLDSAGFVGRHTSLTMGADGLGIISYADQTNGDLKVAHCQNIACTSASTSTLDSAGVVGTSTSLTTGADGLGLISYGDQTGSGLKVAHCQDVACSSASTSRVANAPAVGVWISLTIGADGLGLISYRGGGLTVAHCQNLACTSASTSIVDSISVADTSLTIGADGLGLVSYWDGANGNLKVAHLSNAFGVPYFRRR